MPRILNKRKPIVKVDGFLFDPVAHAYTLNGKPLFGVTSILQRIAKPALINWSANCAVDFLEVCISELEKGGVRISYEGLLGFFKEARIAHRKKKESAGTAGTDAHEMIEMLVKSAIELHEGLITVPESGINIQVDAFIKWARENKIRFLESEKRLYSETFWYAGTCDVVFLDANGMKWIGDVKTGSAIYPEYYFQMAAYQNALEEMGQHLDIKGAMVINTKKNGGLEIGQNFDYEGNLKAFLAVLTLHKQLNALTK